MPQLLGQLELANVSQVLTYCENAAKMKGVIAQRRLPDLFNVLIVTKTDTTFGVTLQLDFAQIFGCSDKVIQVIASLYCKDLSVKMSYIGFLMLEGWDLPSGSAARISHDH